MKTSQSSDKTIRRTERDILEEIPQIVRSGSDLNYISRNYTIYDKDKFRNKYLIDYIFSELSNEVGPKKYEFAPKYFDEFQKFIQDKQIKKINRKEEITDTDNNNTDK